MAFAALAGFFHFVRVGRNESMSATRRPRGKLLTRAAAHRSTSAGADKRP